MPNKFTIFFIVIVQLFSDGCLYISHHTPFECTVTWSIVIINQTNDSLVLKLIDKSKYSERQPMVFSIPPIYTQDASISQVVTGVDHEPTIFSAEAFLNLIECTRNSLSTKDSLWVNPFPFPDWEDKPLCSEFYETGVGTYKCSYDLLDTIYVKSDSLFSTIQFSSNNYSGK